MTKKNYISSVAFRRWVARMCAQFDGNDNAVTRTINSTTYVYLHSKVGKAKCNPSDKWNSDIGVAYAWARCTGQKEYYNEDDLLENSIKCNSNKKENKYYWIRLKCRQERFVLRYVAEGTNNYCFRDPMGNLILYNKEDIKYIKPFEK